MSGGVDSSLAAALLAEEGFRVIGLTLRLFSSSGRKGSEASEGQTAVEKARRAAQTLGIEHRVVDCRREFRRQVIRPFIEEYRRGRTPNPCVECNRTVKFGLLLRKARELGCRRLATGHYVRLGCRGGRLVLRRARDLGKDQSYFLWTLSQRQLGAVMFPLGELSKDRVREMAAGLGLPAAVQEESQEACFVPGGRTSDFLQGRVRPQPGPILDLEGRILGQHRGTALYTIGQRQGLGISLGSPRYVVSIDPAANALTVGRDADLRKTNLWADGANWMAGVPRRAVRALVKIRHQHRGAEAVVRPLGGAEVEVAFREPQRAVTPGQSVVFYRGDLLLGGAVIIK
jgi:tRNA-specific 2-thiouridylase